MNSDELIQETVKIRAKNAEEYTTIEDFDPLEIKYIVGSRGNVSGVILVTTIGGPLVEVHLHDSIVRGRWGGSSHTAPIISNDDVMQSLFEQEAQRFEDTMLA